MCRRRRYAKCAYVFLDHVEPIGYILQTASRFLMNVLQPDFGTHRAAHLQSRSVHHYQKLGFYIKSRTLTMYLRMTLTISFWRSSRFFSTLLLFRHAFHPRIKRCRRLALGCGSKGRIVVSKLRNLLFRFDQTLEMWGQNDTTHARRTSKAERKSFMSPSASLLSSQKALISSTMSLISSATRWALLRLFDTCEL